MRLPYKIIIKSENFEFTIDELNNKFSFEKRPSNMRKKPLYFFLYKPDFKKIKIEHPFDVARLTELTIKKIFKSKFSLENLKNSLKSMENGMKKKLTSIRRRIISILKIL